MNQQNQSRQVTFQGNPLTLMGNSINQGDTSPQFTVRDTDLNEWSLPKKQAFIINVVPSLDTPVCDEQTKKLNEWAGTQSHTSVITISMDLPFAQARYKNNNDITNISFYSDHYDGSFGQAFGLLIKELRLLSRALILVDENQIIQYVEVVPEITTHPDYEKHTLPPIRDNLHNISNTP